MENISWRICYIFYIYVLQICKRYASALLPHRSFDNLYIQAGKLLTSLQMFSNSNPREIWCRNPPLQNLPSGSVVSLLPNSPWWNSLVERRWSGLCRLWSKPGLHTDWARWGEAAASTHLLQREFSTWAEQEIWNKKYATKEFITCAPHEFSKWGLCLGWYYFNISFSYVKRFVTRLCGKTYIFLLVAPNQTICEHGRISEKYNALESDCEMWKHVLWTFLC